MSVSNTDDVIDSRDVIERIEELQGERDSFEVDGEENRKLGLNRTRTMPKNCASLKLWRKNAKITRAIGVTVKL